MVSPRSTRKGNDIPDLDLAHTPTESSFPSIDDAELPPDAQAAAENLQDMDPETLREVIQSLGYELHKKRSRKGGLPKKDSVKDKTRLTVYLPDRLRKDLGHAVIETNTSLTDITTEAIKDWMEKNSFRRPGT